MLYKRGFRRINREIYLKEEKRNFTLTVTIYMPKSLRLIGCRLKKMFYKKNFP